MELKVININAYESAIPHVKDKNRGIKKFSLKKYCLSLYKFISVLLSSYISNIVDTSPL